MAMHSFKFGDLPEQSLRSFAPRQVIGAVNQVISFLALPVRTPGPISLSAEIHGILVDELRWLARVVQDVSDPQAAFEHLAQKLSDGLNIQQIPTASGFSDGARLNMRNALFFCWTALPDNRRNVAEAERIVRLTISRELGLLEEIQRELLGDAEEHR